MSKTVRFVSLLAMISLGGPFIKVANVTVEEAVASSGSSHVIYGRLSGYDVLIEPIVAVLSGGLEGGEKTVAILILLLAVILLLQFVGALARRGNIVLYTSIALFAASFSSLVYILRNDDYLTVRWGFYAWVVLQGILIMISGSNKNKILKQP